MLCRQTDYRLALEQIAHLLSEAHGNLAHHSYRDLVELTTTIERVAHEALYPDPEIPQ
jgi:anti-sigma regulatory factor (Ser/Thr protein kinase)